MFQIRLLVVDPSKSLQTYVRKLFENFGFDPNLIKTASDPASALQLARSLRPDFLLTDWFANATMDGIGLQQAIVSTSPDCRFALISSDTGPDKTALAQSAGAIFLLHKPCTAIELQTALGKALQQLSQENPKINSHVNDMTIAAARHLAALKFAAHSARIVPGDRVKYKGQVDTVVNVIFRKGELVLRLTGVAGTIPVSDVVKVR